MSEDKKNFIEPKQYDLKKSVLNKAQTDKYLMVLSLPECLRKLKTEKRTNKGIDFDTLQFTIKGSPVPDIVIPAIGQQYQGQELKISSHSRQPYENVFIDFLVDELYRNWWCIYYWLDLLNDESHSFFNQNNIAEYEAWQAMKDYTAKFTIYALDNYNNPVIQFDYEGAFPVSLTSPKYNDQKDQMVESRFEFAFTFFKATLI